MRDPEGWVEDDGHSIVRHRHQPLPESHFLRTPIARKLVDNGKLTPYRINGAHEISADRIAFSTYPWEWVPSQLFEAALTTLEIMESVIAGGYELKDASARNVLFRSNRAEFIDHFSFQPLTNKHWWAYGQFLRNFIFPLAVYKYRGFSTADTFRASIDGLSQKQTAAILGTQRFFRRAGLSLFALGRGAREVYAYDSRSQSGKINQAHHKGLIHFLKWQLAGINPLTVTHHSMWMDYEANRSHYSDAAISQKRQCVTQWLKNIAPQSVADLGCNEGEFSLIAAGTARCSVISIDSDINAIEKLRRSVPSNARITPVLSSLEDMSGGRGWSASEFPSLADRLGKRFQVVMALAIIHHLRIGNSIPLKEIARTIASFTNAYCMVEFISPDDSQVQVLANQRGLVPKNIFSLEEQRNAFRMFFYIIEEIPLEGTQRCIALLRLHSSGS